jgi:hypothetical protein
VIVTRHELDRERLPRERAGGSEVAQTQIDRLDHGGVARGDFEVDAVERVRAPHVRGDHAHQIGSGQR